jgi:hypothetical protein
MKARILSLAFALIALFAFNDANAQNCHQVGRLSISVVNGDDIQLSGKIAGLGNVNEQVNYTISGDLTGTFECVPPGQQKKGQEGSVAPGQTTISYTASGTGTPRNGRLEFSTSQDSDCNEQFALRISGASLSNATITIYNADGTVYCTAPLTL